MTGDTIAAVATAMTVSELELSGSAEMKRWRSRERFIGQRAEKRTSEMWNLTRFIMDLSMMGRRWQTRFW